MRSSFSAGLAKSRCRITPRSDFGKDSNAVMNTSAVVSALLTMAPSFRSDCLGFYAYNALGPIA